MPTCLHLFRRAPALFFVPGDACTFLSGWMTRTVLLVLVGAALASCGGGRNGSAGLPFLPVTTPPLPPGATYPISGTVVGLQGSGLVLQNNAGDDLPVAADGVIRFAVPVASGAGYAVTVKAQPINPAQTCTVTNASGTVVDVAIGNVVVVCSVNSYRVGGTVDGLAGAGLVLQNNADDDLAVAADGAFEFTVPVASGANYAVTVKTQPTAPSQTCTVNNAGAVVGDASVKVVKVICATDSYSVGGTISGLRGRGLVLQNNEGDDLALSYSLNGTFSFTMPVASGAGYVVKVKTQPQFLSQLCTVSNGSGTVASAAVTSVTVSCVSSASTPARFAYVTNYGADTVSAYTIDVGTGALSPMAVPTVATGDSPYSITIDPGGRFAYVANYMAGTVSAYTLDAGTGALSPTAVPTVATGSGPYSVTVDPTGRFAYVANYNADTVSAYTIDAGTGALSPIAAPTMATGRRPYSVIVDPTGRFAYVANALSYNVSAYTIDAGTGALTAAAGSPFAAGTSPPKIAVDPTGRFAYVTSAGTGTALTYNIDAGTGALSPMAMSPVTTGNSPFFVTVDPTGRLAYVSNSGSNTLSAYTIDADTGALNPLAVSTVTTGSYPYSVIVDPTGRFAYVTNINSDTVSAYTIDTVTGALSPMAGPTVVAGLRPIGIAFAR